MGRGGTNEDESVLAGWGRGRTCFFVSPPSGPWVRWSQKAQAIHRKQARAELCPGSTGAVALPPVTKRHVRRLEVTPRTSPAPLSPCVGRCVFVSGNSLLSSTVPHWTRPKPNPTPSRGRVCVGPTAFQRRKVLYFMWTSPSELFICSIYKYMCT